MLNKIFSRLTRDYVSPFPPSVIGIAHKKRTVVFCRFPHALSERFRVCQPQPGGKLCDRHIAAHSLASSVSSCTVQPSTFASLGIYFFDTPFFPFSQWQTAVWSTFSFFASCFCVIPAFSR